MSFWERSCGGEYFRKKDELEEVGGGCHWIRECSSDLQGSQSSLFDGLFCCCPMRSVNGAGSSGDGAASLDGEFTFI